MNASMNAVPVLLSEQAVLIGVFHGLAVYRGQPAQRTCRSRLSGQQQRYNRLALVAQALVGVLAEPGCSLGVGAARAGRICDAKLIRMKEEGG